jgi:hypothetical protein
MAAQNILMLVANVNACWEKEAAKIGAFGTVKLS